MSARLIKERSPIGAGRVVLMAMTTAAEKRPIVRGEIKGTASAMPDPATTPGPLPPDQAVILGQRAWDPLLGSLAPGSVPPTAGAKPEVEAARSGR